MTTASSLSERSPKVVSRFAIVAAPRTGSNLLCSLLNSHPDVLCHHEIFNPRGIRYALDYRDNGFQLGTIAERDAQPIEFLQRVWANSCAHLSVGFKWTLGQDQTILDHILHDRNTVKLLLVRRNRVKTFVSYKIAEILGQWEVYDEAMLSAARPRIHVDIDELRQHARLVAEFNARVERTLAASTQRWLKLFYEDLLEERSRLRLLEFLGLRAWQMQPVSIKQNPTDLRELVTNYAQLTEEFESGDLLPELLDPCS